MSYLTENDPSFWSDGRRGSEGLMGVVGITRSFLNPESRARREETFMCYLNKGNTLPAYLAPVFKKHFFGKACCARCTRTMTLLKTRVLREFTSRGGVRNLYYVCNCGYPVWSAHFGVASAFISAIGPAERTWRRKETLKEAGGHHTRSEIYALIALQDNRCIYCNKVFTNDLRPQKDHFLAVAHGGTDWASNIVMACSRCNFRRSDTPFRTYCRILSPTQNRRILAHLAKRILAMDVPNLPGDTVASFDEGLAHHDAWHPRFRNMQSRSVIKRRYAAINQLLPGTRSLVLRKHRLAFPGAASPAPVPRNPDEFMDYKDF